MYCAIDSYNFIVYRELIKVHMEQVTKLNNEYDIKVQQYIVQECTDQNTMKLNVNELSL